VLKKAARFVFSIIKISFLLGLAVTLLPRLLTGLYSLARIYTVDDVPSEPIAIVFGAGLWRDGTPTAVLRDRVESAVELFFSGKVQMILMSGDNRHENYNEPAAMRDYALSLGVPDSAIVLDYAGRRTYDTCYRARDVFGIQRAILVTQSFHLPRAIYTCNALGIRASGVASDQREYRLASHLYWNLRELPATLTALLDVHIVHPTPVLGEPEPVFPRANQ
jgi:vancomycin permeability regulator SanA